MHSTEELIGAIQDKQMVILMDDEDRENEGDLVMSAEAITADSINFMARFARGLICLSLSEAHCRKLNLPLMVTNNTASLHTNFTHSIDASKGITTGISAADRAATIAAAVAPNSCSNDIVTPGHIFPLMAQAGGVLRRAGHTEASCDLAKLAGFSSAAVIVEIMNEDGSMARCDDLQKFSQHHNLKIGTIADLITYRSKYEVTVKAGKKYDLKTKWGVFQATVYTDLIQGGEHLALTYGTLNPDEAVAVRVQIIDILSDLLLDGQTDNWSASSSLKYIAQQGKGAVILINEFNNPLANIYQKLTTQHHRPVNNHGYTKIGMGSQILRDLGIKKMHLLSAPMKFNALSGYDLLIEEYIPYTPNLNPKNK